MPTLILTCLLWLASSVMAQSPSADEIRLRDELEARTAEVRQQQELCRQASAEADRFDMEVLKRQQGVMNARRSGDSVSAAQGELDLSRDKSRLAQTKASAANLELLLAQARQARARARCQRWKLSLQLESAAAEERPGLEDELATLDKQLGTLELEIPSHEKQAEAGRQKASSLSAELEAKWGARLSGKKPEAQRVYHARPSQEGEPEEATEL